MVINKSQDLPGSNFLVAASSPGVTELRGSGLVCRTVEPTSNQNRGRMAYITIYDMERYRKNVYNYQKSLMVHHGGNNVTLHGGSWLAVLCVSSKFYNKIGDLVPLNKVK